MPRRDSYTRRKSYSNEPRRRRPLLKRPEVQIGILLVTALIVFILLQSAGK